MGLVQPLHEQRRTAVGSQQLGDFEQPMEYRFRRLLDHPVHFFHRQQTPVGAVEAAAKLGLDAVENQCTHPFR